MSTLTPYSYDTLTVTSNVARYFDDANIDWMADITVSIMNESTVKLDIKYSFDI